jgi:hypothetical protein
MTEEEKKLHLHRLEQRAAERRAAREKEDAASEKEREAIRIKNQKEAQKAAEKWKEEQVDLQCTHQPQERRDIEAAKREKLAAAKAKEDIKRKIEQDKLERAAKRSATTTVTAAPPASSPAVSPAGTPAASFDTCVIQVLRS